MWVEVGSLDWGKFLVEISGKCSLLSTKPKNQRNKQTKTKPMGTDKILLMRILEIISR